MCGGRDTGLASPELATEALAGLDPRGHGADEPSSCPACDRTAVMFLGELSHALMQRPCGRTIVIPSTVRPVSPVTRSLSSWSRVRFADADVDLLEQHRRHQSEAS